MKDIQPINKGIVQDSNEEFQPEGSYRFMLNGMFESIEGERGGIVNEQGNSIIITMPAGVSDPHLNGTCLLPNQDVVLFITGWDGNQDIQIIALHKNNDTYLELIRTNCLEYSRCSQIDCKFKVHNGCDIILYFTDNETKYKSINITSIENNTTRYKDPNHSPWTFPLNLGTLPNVPDVDPGIGIGSYGWLCNAFYLTPVSEHPNIFFNNISENGNLRVGTYTFFIRLLDGDLNPTDWLTWSNPITVKQGAFNFNSPPDNLDGFYIDPTVANYTSKSISLIIDNLDTAFQYYEVGIMERSLNTNTVTNTYRTGQKLIPKPSGSDIFLFTNVSDTRYINIDPSVLLTKNRKVDIVGAHTQIQNRLILGNIKGITRDWHKFQQQANLIRTEYFTYSKVDIADTGCSAKKHHVVTGPKALDPDYEGVNYSSPEFLSYGMSLMRDEVYALGIIYVFRDGSESPVFHIPGRPKFGSGETTSYLIDGFDYAFYARNWIKTQSQSILDASVGAPLENSSGAGTTLLDFDTQSLQVIQHSNIKGSWKSTRLGNLTQENNILNDLNQDDYKYLYGWSDAITCCYNIPFSNNNCSDDLERWMYYNTAIRRKEEEDTAVNMWYSFDATSNILSDLLSNPYYTFSNGFRGIPGYYDTGINYPDIQDCDGNRIYPEGNVRHHKMPDHRIEQLFDMVGDLGLNKVTGGGQITESAWILASNMLTGVTTAPVTGPTLINGIDPTKWTMNDSESVFQLYPLGLNFHNVNVPEEFREDVVGYYIVRSDRTNNKTVIDKGFMNVCDTSISTRDWVPNIASNFEIVDDFLNLSAANNVMYTNDLFLTPNSKPGMYDFGLVSGYNSKQPIFGWWNIMELHTPKANYNESVLLSGDYLKLEATLFGDMFFDSSLSTSDYHNSYYDASIPPQLTGWNIGMSVVLNRHKYPRVQSPVNNPLKNNEQPPELEPALDNLNRWAFVYNIPISGLSYVNFNDDSTTSALGGGNTTLYNKEFKQRTLLAKHTQTCTAASPGLGDAVLNSCNDTGVIDSFRASCDVSFPFHYTMLKKDILFDNGSAMYIIPGPVTAWNLDSIIVNSANNALYSNYLSWSNSTNVTSTYKWSVPHSPYMYYFALKSAINPYEDFDGIRYIKMHSYLIPSDPIANAPDQSFAVTGGDTFINRFQYEKGYWQFDGTGPEPDQSNIKFLTTTTVGYVESEINTAFKHLKDGDLFRTFPVNSRNSYYDFLANAGPTLGTGATDDQIHTYMDKQEIIYRYKLDYSSYNTEIPSFQLPSTWDYCSNCQESYPNTLIYSEVSLDSQVQDYYKIFLTNSEKDIPSYTGSIQNLFVKNSDLYVHTEHNLWKLSVAPQTMQTNSDSIVVGQGAFLDRDPIRIFNNQDSFSRGGCVDKFSSAYGGGDYVWMDRNSGSVLSLGEGIGSLSDIGLSRWFRNNSEVNLDTQFRLLTGLDYPFKGTSCNLNVGYIGTLDPQHNRYILSKKDYKLVDEVYGSVNEITYDITGLLYDPAIVTGSYYYDDNGFYIGIGDGDVVADKATLLEYMDYTDPAIAANKSWTISFSFKDKLWSSWHSYLPNWLYNDSYTFYSFITNPNTSANQYIWQHGFGLFQTFYGVKYDFIIDYIYKKDMYSDATYDTIEYTSNVWTKSVINDTWVEVPLKTFDRFFVYNNTQLSNMKYIGVSNLTAYTEIQYNVSSATAHNWRDTWKIARLRDMSVDRLSAVEPKFTTNWLEPTYQAQFFNGGYIDKVINPAMIDLLKPVYKIERLTDKYLGVRLFYNPEEDYKITFNLYSGLKRNKI